jgi:hypothetical protein
MNNGTFYSKPQKSIPFRLNDHQGKVSVYYGANKDPHWVGFDSLPGINFDFQRSRGYPVIHARIELYGGTGYRMFCGWIQIVTSVYRDSHDPKIARSETFVSADMAPAFEEAGIPFAAYGYLPQLFDAPCLNSGDGVELRWTADTFLTTAPMRARDETISRLLGFRWGYTENDNPGKKPVLLPLQVTDGEAWNQYLPYLREQFSQWKFQPA